jgi:hypothetical protein
VYVCVRVCVQRSSLPPLACLPACTRFYANEIHVNALALATHVHAMVAYQTRAHIHKHTHTQHCTTSDKRICSRRGPLNSRNVIPLKYIFSEPEHYGPVVASLPPGMYLPTARLCLCVHVRVCVSLRVYVCVCVGVCQLV